MLLLHSLVTGVFLLVDFVPEEILLRCIFPALQSTVQAYHVILR